MEAGRTDLEPVQQGRQLQGVAEILPAWMADESHSLAATDLEGAHANRIRRQYRGITVFARPMQVLHLAGAFFSHAWGEEVGHGHAFLFVPVFLGLGVVIWFCLPFPAVTTALAVAAALLALASAVSWHRSHAARLAFLGACLIFCGMLLADLEARRAATVILDMPVTSQITGIVERREVIGQGRWRYLVRIEAVSDPVLARPPSRVAVVARGALQPVSIGDRISGRARLSPPSGPALPGLNDFSFSAYFDGIGAVGYFYRPPVILASGVGPPSLLSRVQAFLFALRGEIGDRIRATVGGDAGAFAAAIVTDERRAISVQTTEALRLAGLAHIVAISGLNMALAAGIFFIGLRGGFALMPGISQALPVKKIAAFAAILMVTAYYLISGFGVSAERAYIMMTIMLGAVLFDRPSISLRNVALSAIVVIVLSPSEILGPSFQMSFAATLALVAGYSALSGRRRTRHGARPARRHWGLALCLAVASLTGGILLTSLIGSASTMIYSIDHFHRFASYGLAANLAAMPIISFVVMPMALLGMLLMPFGLDGPFLIVMGWGLEAVIVIARQVASWGGDVAIGRQPEPFLPLATAGLLILALLRSRLRYLGLPLLAAALAMSAGGQAALPPDLIIAEDGMLVAAIEADRVMINRNKAPAFLYDQWRRALLLGPPVTAQSISQPRTPKTAPDGPAADAAERPKSEGLTGRDVANKGSGGERPVRERLERSVLIEAESRMRQAPADRFLCVASAWCAISSYTGAVIVIVDDLRYIGAACDAATLVIAAKARFDDCRSGALLFSGRTLRKTGAVEISFNGLPDPALWSLTAAFAHTDRQWQRHRQYDWKTGSYDGSLPQSIASLLFPEKPGNGSGPAPDQTGSGPGEDAVESDASLSAEILDDQW